MPRREATLAASRRKRKMVTPMILTDSFLADAGWLFFAAWSAVVTVVSIIAFGRDLLPWRTQLDSASKSQHADPVRPSRPAAR